MKWHFDGTQCSRRMKMVKRNRKCAPRSAATRVPISDFCRGDGMPSRCALVRPASDGERSSGRDKNCRRFRTQTSLLNTWRCTERGTRSLRNEEWKMAQSRRRTLCRAPPALAKPRTPRFESLATFPSSSSERPIVPEK